MTWVNGRADQPTGWWTLKGVYPGVYEFRVRAG